MNAGKILIRDGEKHWTQVYISKQVFDILFTTILVHILIINYT